MKKIKKFLKSKTKVNNLILIFGILVVLVTIYTNHISNLHTECIINIVMDQNNRTIEILNEQTKLFKADFNIVMSENKTDSHYKSFINQFINGEYFINKIREEKYIYCIDYKKYSDLGFIISLILVFSQITLCYQQFKNYFNT